MLGIYKRLRWLVVVTAVSCTSVEESKNRLNPPKRTSDLRLEDIRQYVANDPARAIHLVGMYEILYAEDQAGPALALKNEAIDNLKAVQSKAISEKRWDDAASMARSLASLEIPVETTGNEPDFILAGAKQKLADNNDLGAFLSAARSHELESLSFEDALLFLERAVAVRQRRTAAFFLNAASARQTGEKIPEELRTYAEGKDAAGDMIKGVATVVVDRGMRIERGFGMADRVLGSAFFVDAAGLL
ncbi:MAG: trypsin, partial [Spirochaetaceae bacterium]|nr:trypsin [Spirochaetaceae bacterium]